MGGALGDKTENDEHGLLQRCDIEMHVLTRIRRHVHDQQQTPCACESMNGGLSYIAIVPAGSVSDVVHPTNGQLDCVAFSRDVVMERTGASLRYIYKGSSAIDRTTVFVAVFTSATV